MRFKLRKVVLHSQQVLAVVVLLHALLVQAVDDLASKNIRILVGGNSATG